MEKNYLRDPLLAESDSASKLADLAGEPDEDEHGRATPDSVSSPALSKSSLAASVFNLTNTIIGAGIMYVLVLVWYTGATGSICRMSAVCCRG